MTDRKEFWTLEKEGRIVDAVEAGSYVEARTTLRAKWRKDFSKHGKAAAKLKIALLDELRAAIKDRKVIRPNYQEVAVYGKREV